eukprot:scaffold67644_cov35-Tisochrysis_lutea.AAC.2
MPFSCRHAPCPTRQRHRMPQILLRWGAGARSSEMMGSDGLASLHLAWAKADTWRIALLSEQWAKQSLGSNLGSASLVRLHRLGARNDLSELGGDLGLSQAVICELELVDHVLRVVRGRIHRSHARRLLRGLILKKTAIHGARKIELIEISKNFLLLTLKFVLIKHSGLAEHFWALERHSCDVEGNDRLELVVEDRVAEEEKK